MGFIVLTNNIAEKCVMLFDSQMYLRNWPSEDICCITFSTYFLTKYHIVESLCMTSFSLFTKVGN